MSELSSSPPLLQVDDLIVRYPVKKGLLQPRKHVHAVNGVSFTVRRGETLALVGESGCGKTTVGRSIMRLVRPSSGAIRVDGIDVASLSRRQLKPYRRKIQMVFQDPYASLNPRMTAGEIIGEPLGNFGIAHGADRESRIMSLLERVGLGRSHFHRYPHEFSGGQRQRLGIARALAVEPSLIVGDEPLSALDVSVQAQIVNLLDHLQQEFGLSYLFIAHDLAVVQQISHRVAVMYLGRIVEIGETADIFRAPIHPYTQALLAAVPLPDPRKRRTIEPLRGEVPSPISPPSGCAFHPRCPLAEDRCRREVPRAQEFQAGHFAACHVMARNNQYAALQPVTA
ncbi:ABC transporter ATP-binding protein [Microvirga solisilvae]|uniref:ABC transporter ATP-binding protein n=1 Tax=Microvirga solisilvae TaxID=2919498 RepID=UPI001FAF3D9C|nr:dipeptide ABC transporter ATP-binding protein [Microvirga solisilvae]